MNCICFSLYLKAFLTVFKHVLSTFRGFITRGNFVVAAAYYNRDLTTTRGELPAEAEEDPTTTSK